VLLTALGLSVLVVLADALLRGPLSAHGLPRQLGAVLISGGALVVLAGVVTAFRRAWHRSIRRAGRRAWDRWWAWSAAMWRGGRRGNASASLRAGERVALIVGLCLTGLDVVLTVLLLKDVFPAPPYRFDVGGLLSPAAADWSFYVAVAGFKTGLEVWFGVVDRVRRHAGEPASASATAARWFVLGGASAFDAVLAASRGLLLAEQGLDGAAVAVSNVLFVGFGIAVPWVAAMTGGLLVAAADPLLARLSPLALVADLARLGTLAAAWLVVLLVGLPALATLGALGLLTAAWFAVEDIVALVLGEDDGPPPDAIVLFEAAEPAGDSSREPPRAGRHAASGGVP
jgi:hypothetical protein